MSRTALGLIAAPFVFLFMTLIFCISIIALCGYAFAIYTAATAEEWGWLAVDVLIPPFGAVHGIGIFLGFWG